MAKQAKAAEAEGQDNKTLEDKAVIESAASETFKVEVVKPGAGVGESKTEDWKQKYQTLDGIHKQVVGELNIIKKDRQDFTSLSQKLDQYGQTLDLLVDTISATELGGNEELKEKLQKTREEAAARLKTQQESYAKQQTVLERIKKVAEAAGLKEEDEVLMPVKKAWLEGKVDEAFDLTIIAALGQRKAETPKSEEKPTEKPKKETLRVITSSPAPGKSSADMSPKEKMLAGLEEARRKRD